MSGNIKISKWDAAEFLENQKDIDAYLKVAFETGDPTQINKALSNAARAKGIKEISNKNQYLQPLTDI